MTTPADLAATSRLLGDPARAAMVCALMGGCALAAGELASVAGVTAATASGHLKRLVAGGLLAVVPQGKHRYFRISRAEVAEAIEALGALAGRGSPAQGHPAWRHGSELRFARTCYDHLAGISAVAIHDGLIARGYLAAGENGYAVTAAGEAGLGRLGLDLARVRRSQRAFACPCLDWSERRPHLGGALAAAMLEACIGQGWVKRADRPRLIHLTQRGRLGLRETLGISL